MRFAAKILDSINIFKEDFKEKYNCDYFINVEQIPGERAAEILMEKIEFSTQIKNMSYHFMVTNGFLLR